MSDTYNELHEWFEREQRRWYNRPLAWLYQRSKADEESYVNDHQRARRLASRRTPVYLLLAVGGLLLAAFFVDWPWALMPVVAAYGAIGSVAAQSPRRRAEAYRNGWVAGRRELEQSIRENDRAGVPVEVILQQEWIKGTERALW